MHPRPATFACQFVRTGRFDAVEIEVESVRAGRRSEALRATVLQDGRTRPRRLELVRGRGARRGSSTPRAKPPAVPAPEALRPFSELAENYDDWYPFWRQVEGRPARWELEAGPAVWHTWMRLLGGAPDDPLLDAARVVLWADLFPWNAAAARHDWPRRWIAPNLDLTVQFHAPAVGEDWMLCDAAAPIASGGPRRHRTAGSGRCDGRLVASAVGAALLRAEPALRGGARRAPPGRGAHPGRRVRELRGRVAVVTGGGSGIGAALARACAARGHGGRRADVDLAAAEAVAGSSAPTARRALAAAVDVRERASLDALAERTFAELGGCHLLCNNAGVVVFRPLAETTERDFAWLLGVNALGVFHGVAAFLPRMRAQGGEAHMLNTASMAGPRRDRRDAGRRLHGEQVRRRRLLGDAPRGARARRHRGDGALPRRRRDADRRERAQPAPPSSATPRRRRRARSARATRASSSRRPSPPAPSPPCGRTRPTRSRTPSWWPFVEARFEALRAAFGAGAPGGARAAPPP